MITLPSVRVILASRGIRVSIRTLQRWSAKGMLGAIYGRRDRRYLMREAQVKRILRGEQAAVWQRR